MIAVKGTYKDGVVRLDTTVRSKKRLKVIVTFLDDDASNKPKRLSIKDFSFQKSREKSKRFKGSLADSVIEDRKADI